MIGCGIGIWDAKVEIGVDIRVQVQLSLLDELHHRRPGEQLADGANSKDRLFGVDRDALLEVGVAVAFGKEQLAVFDDGYGCTGDVILFHLLCKQLIQEGPPARRDRSDLVLGMAQWVPFLPGVTLSSWAVADPTIDSRIVRVNRIVIDIARDFLIMSWLFIFFLLYRIFLQISLVELKLLAVETPDGYGDKNDARDYRRDQRQP